LSGYKQQESKMTWLSIIDTAIKIGLGAFIGGIFTFILNKQKQDNEIKREIILDTRQTLKDATKRFEIIHTDLIAFIQDYSQAFSIYLHKLNSIEKKIESTNFDVTDTIPNEPDFFNQRIDVANKLIKDLYLLQGVLLLYGFTNLSSIIYEYTANVEIILPNFTKEDFKKDYLDRDEIKKFTDLRNCFYTAAREYFY
jgi:hypothetical protein